MRTSNVCSGRVCSVSGLLNDGLQRAGPVAGAGTPRGHGCELGAERSQTGAKEGTAEVHDEC
jgi:hypothetical protein